MPRVLYPGSPDGITPQNNSEASRPGTDVDVVQTQSVSVAPVTPLWPLTSIHPLGFLTLCRGASVRAEGNDLAKVLHLCHRGQAFLSPPDATDPSGNLLTLKGALLRTALDAENKTKKEASYAANDCNYPEGTGGSQQPCVPGMLTVWVTCGFRCACWAPWFFGRWGAKAWILPGPRWSTSSRERLDGEVRHLVKHPPQLGRDGKQCGFYC